MKQASIRILALSLVLGLVVGCEKKEQSPGGATKKPKIALIMKALNNEFFRTMEEGAKKHQAAHSAEYDLLSTGISVETEVDKQAALVDQMIAQGVDAIVLTPADSKQLVLPAKRAIDKGIVVVNIDNKLDGQVADALKVKIPFVGPDNAKGAKMVADYLARHLKKGDKVALINGVPGTFNAQQREKGFRQAMEEAGMQIVVSQTAEWDTAKAEKVVGAILPGHPDLKAILCANDLMAEGAVTAVQAAGKGGQILIIGFDNTTAAQTLIKSGRMLATADQHADQQAAWGIEYALQILQNKATPQDKETVVDLITAETLKAK